MVHGLANRLPCAAAALQLLPSCTSSEQSIVGSSQLPNSAAAACGDINGDKSGNYGAAALHHCSRYFASLLWAGTSPSAWKLYTDDTSLVGIREVVRPMDSADWPRQPVGLDRCAPRSRIDMHARSKVARLLSPSQAACVCARSCAASKATRELGLHCAAVRHLKDGFRSSFGTFAPEPRPKVTYGRSAGRF